MGEDNTKPCDAEGEGKMICSGIWGGIRDTDQDINTDGLAASLYSSSCDGGKGGDIYYLGACKGCQLTRVAVAERRRGSSVSIKERQARGKMDLSVAMVRMAVTGSLILPWGGPIISWKKTNRGLRLR